MRIAYAYRRDVLYPSHGNDPMAREETRGLFLRQIRDCNFDGIELGLISESETQTKDLGKQLADTGLPCVAVRGEAIDYETYSKPLGSKRQNFCNFAKWVGAEIINTIVPLPEAGPSGKEVSRAATVQDLRCAATRIRELAIPASDFGINISIEVHQNTIADTSMAALRLLKLVDQPNVGLNPDLGNVYWAFDTPEESCEEAILQLAPHAKYWHCKNLHRVYFEDLERSAFIQTSLPDGDVDYRFALAAMIDANYKGDIAIEGIRLGDQFHQDAKSTAYMKKLLTELGSKRTSTTP